MATQATADTQTGIEVKLVGEDGNPFAIMGRVVKALKRGGRGDLVEQYRADAMSGDYNHLLQVTLAYVVEPEADDEDLEECPDCGETDGSCSCEDECYACGETQGRCECECPDCGCWKDNCTCDEEPEFDTCDGCGVSHQECGC